MEDRAAQYNYEFFIFRRLAVIVHFVQLPKLLLTNTTSTAAYLQQTTFVSNALFPKTALVQEIPKGELTQL